MSASIDPLAASSRLLPGGILRPRKSETVKPAGSMLTCVHRVGPLESRGVRAGAPARPAAARATLLVRPAVRLPGGAAGTGRGRLGVLLVPLLVVVARVRVVRLLARLPNPIHCRYILCGLRNWQCGRTGGLLRKDGPIESTHFGPLLKPSLLIWIGTRLLRDGSSVFCA